MSFNKLVLGLTSQLKDNSPVVFVIPLFKNQNFKNTVLMSTDIWFENSILLIEQRVVVYFSGIMYINRRESKKTRNTSEELGTSGIFT